MKLVVIKILPSTVLDKTFLMFLSETGELMLSVILYSLLYTLQLYRVVTSYVLFYSQNLPLKAVIDNLCHILSSLKTPKTTYSF